VSRVVSSPLLRLFRIRDYSLLWSGSTVSLFGDGIYFVAIPWEVYHLSSSPAAYGFVGAAFALPQVLFVLVGGVISDRLNRRALMVGASVSSAVAIGVLGLLIELHLEQLWMIGALVFLYGTSQAIFMPASKALTPSLVPVELLPQATAMNQLLEPITLAVVGPAVGGLIIAAFGTGAAFLVDSATFAVAVAAMALMSGGAIRRAAAEGPERKASVLREAREAIGFVRRTPWIWVGLLSAAIANVSLTGPLTVLTPYVVKYNLHGTATDLGLIFAVGGIGGVIAGAYVAVRGTPRRKVTWTFLSWAIATLAMSPIGFATATWQLMLLSIIIVGGLTLGNLIWFTLMGALVPNEMLGRVSSLDMMVSFSLTPVSNALTGPLALLVGVRNTLLGAGILGAVVGVAALLVPGVLDPEKADVSPAPTSAR
jgi:MFS family permease